MDVGTRLKSVRVMHNLSQRELAKRAGVTNSTISMIEKNSVSPSVSSLKKVLSGIPMSLVTFFSLEMDGQGSEPVVFRSGDSSPMNMDNILIHVIGQNKPNRAMSFMDELYPPESDTGVEMLCHEGEEAGIVIEGLLELTVGNDVYELTTGDSYYFDSNKPHRFRNPSTENSCRLISCTSPGNF
ncbi:cupin domain-containing protein [uncultured Endozoicomonas sp.]|uniref:cupin domain-containing protein n=1 Tax=uncultured Endozoicomonas sp. TaxID=432652 RepID=UPI00261D5A28|nr:cupin domain-containing protein [uncultured Endozoicomonas sp.]